MRIKESFTNLIIVNKAYSASSRERPSDPYRFQPAVQFCPHIG